MSQDIKVTFTFLYGKRDEQNEKTLDVLHVINRDKFYKKFISCIVIDNEERKNIIKNNKEAREKLKEGPIFIQCISNNSQKGKCKKNIIIYPIDQMSEFLANITRLSKQ